MDYILAEAEENHEREVVKKNNTLIFIKHSMILMYFWAHCFDGILTMAIVDRANIPILQMRHLSWGRWG